MIALALVLLREPVRFGVTLLSFAIGAAVLLTLAYRSSVRHGATWRFDPRWSVLRDTWRRTLHFAGSEMLNQFYARTDLLLIAFFLGQEHVGFYATDIKFVEVGTRSTGPLRRGRLSRARRTGGRSGSSVMPRATCVASSSC